VPFPLLLRPATVPEGTMERSIQTSLPLALKIVAALFAIYGLWAAYIMILRGLRDGYFVPDFTILCLLVGLGLLRRSEPARVGALAFTCIFLAMTVVAVIFFVIKRPASIDVPVLGRLTGQLEGAEGTVYVVVTATLYCAINLWQAWVLTRPDVRHRFGHSV
jgi:hypothetical protein